jgi:hypothetical protein
MSNRHKCEMCDNEAIAKITYFSEFSRKRVGYALCSQHGKEFWERIPHPYKETAIIIDMHNQSTATCKDE